MFDLTKDLPIPESGSSNTTTTSTELVMNGTEESEARNSKKRKREAAKDSLRKGTTGAGGIMSMKEVPVTKMRKFDSDKADDTQTTTHLLLENGQGDAAESDDEEIYDANQGTKIVDLEEDHEAALEAATRQFELDRDAKFEEQKAEATDMLRAGWSMDTIELYMLLDRRTLETLMPYGFS